MARLPRDLSTEALLDALNSDPKEVNALDLIEYKNDIIDFLRFYKINKGDNEVKSANLYRLYKNWSRNPIPQLQFSLDIQNFLPRSSYGTSVKLLVNIEAKDLILLVTKPTHNRVIFLPEAREHFNRFIKDCNIKRGTMFVHLHLLHEMYLRWTKEKRVKKTFAWPGRFADILRLHSFNQKWSRTRLFIGINHKTLTKEQLKALKRKMRDEKQQAPKVQISSPRSKA